MAMFFLLGSDEYRYEQLFGDMRQVAFSGRDEYPETINGAYELLVCNSRQFCGRILKV